MKKLFLMSAILILMLTGSISAQAKVRVNFAKNQNERTVSGAVIGTNYIDYVLRVKQYFFIEAEFISGDENLKFSVLNSKGKTLDEGNKVRIFSGEAEKTGDYTIRVYGSGVRSNRFRLRIAAFMGT